MLKKMIALLLALLTLISVCQLSAFAAPTLEEAMAEVDIYGRDEKLKWLTMNGSVKVQYYTYYLYESHMNGQVKEIPAYCVDPRLDGVPTSVPEGTAIKYGADSIVSDEKVAAIIANGYPHTTLKDLGLETVEEAYYATKTALWIYLLGNWTVEGLGINPNLTGTEKQAAQRVLNAVKDIYWRGMNWDIQLTPRLTATPDRDSAYPVTVSGRKYYQQVFTITSDTWAENQEVYVSLAAAAPDGTLLLNEQGERTTKVVLDRDSTDGHQGKLIVRYPAAAVEGESGAVQINLNATVVQYAIYYARSLEKDKYGNIQDYMLDTDPSIPMAASLISTYAQGDDGGDPSVPSTGLRIIKLEEGTGIPLDGAVFRVTAPDGTVLGSYSTSTDGTITIPCTQTGIYTVEETTPPKWHTLSNTPVQQVRVEYGKVSEVTFTNAPYGELRVEKISDVGDSLRGVKVQIKHIESGATQTGVTGSGGTVTFTHLQPGAYEVRELAGIPGWQADTQTVQTISITAGENAVATIVNKELPGLNIVKFDRITLETLPHVVFEIWHDGNSLGQFTTDQMGEIYLTDLAPGTYLVQEVHSDEEHILTTTPQQIELKAGEGIRQLVFFNDRLPGIHLVKVDSRDLSKPIANATFRIEAVDGSWGPEELTTQVDGTIDLSNLPVGAYVVTELSCPGYIIDDEQRIIHLDGNETAQFVFTNTSKPSLTVVKYDPVTDKYLPGAIFRVAKIEDGSHYLDRVTDTDGRFTITGLEPGVYSVQEQAAPSGYVLNSREYHVELFPGQESQVVVVNEAKPDLRIVKTDADTGEPVSGVTFTVRYADGSTVTTEATNAKGEVYLENMEPGTYEVWEQSVPDNYIIDTEHQHITLEPNRIGTVQFQNHQRPTLIINKVDLNGKPLTGAIFELKSKAGVKIGDFPVDTNGKVAISNVHLSEGYYIVTETQAPEGYILDSTPYEVYLRPGKTTEISIENEKKPDLLIQKIDSVVGDGIKGAKFEVLVAKDKSTDGAYERLDSNYYYTDANGRIKIDDLDTGWYKIVEVEPAPGYMLKEPSEQTVYVDNDKSVTVVFENIPKSALVISKVDGDTGVGLSGAWFRVRYLGGTSGSGGTVIGEYQTSTNGNVILTGMDAGTYIVEELSAPEGYVTDAAPQTAYISGEVQSVVTLTFTNSAKGGLLIKKVDSATGKPLSDVQFFVTDSEGTVIGSANGYFTTDSSGSILISDIDPGTTLVVKETRTCSGYVLDDTPQTIEIQSGAVVNLEFRNQPMGNLIVYKMDSVTHKPLEGVQFKITYADGKVVDAASGQLSSNGLYRTDKNGQITISGITGTVVVTETKTIPGYTIHEESRSQTVVVNTNDTQRLYFYNDPIGGVEIIKVNEANRAERIPGATFEIRKVDDELVDTVTTDRNGRASCDLKDGAYYIVEVEAAEGYRLDSTPIYFEVENGETVQLRVTNEEYSGILIHKTDANTGAGISGVSFVLYDSRKNPIGEYVSDNRGYVYIEDISSGRYYLREMEPAEGYIADTQLKSIYVTAGTTTEVEWENTPITGQIQITKTSADYNTMNGWPAGTAIPNTVFEVYNVRTGKLVDTIQTDKNGVAVTKPLPLGRYKLVESKAADFYGLDKTPIEVHIEYAGQIVKAAMTNKSLYTNVSIKKTSYVEVMPGQNIRYSFSEIANNSTTALTSFYWRDTLPVAVTLNKIMTGTYNVQGSYKIVYRTNLSGDTYRTMADNLSTQKNNVVDASPATLGLASNERVTEFMLVFGTVPANFRQVEAPRVDCKVADHLAGGTQFVNQADVGGVYNGQWIMANSRWVTRVYKPSAVLPRTGY